MFLNKPFPVNNEAETIGIAKEAFPDAENDLVAVDMLAQDIYKFIRNNENNSNPAIDLYDEIEFYGYLQYLRKTIFKRMIEEDSEFKIKERSNNA